MHSVVGGFFPGYVKSLLELRTTQTELEKLEWKKLFWRSYLRICQYPIV